MRGLAFGFVAGFALGAWFGARRTLARIRSFVGPERWDRVERQVALRPRARSSAKP